MFKFIALLCFVAFVFGTDTTTTGELDYVQVYHDTIAAEIDVIDARVHGCWRTDANVQYDKITNMTGQCVAKNINFDDCIALLVPLETMAAAQNLAITALCLGKHTILDAIIVGVVAATGPTCMSQMATLETTLIGYEAQCMGLVVADKPVFIIEASKVLACFQLHIDNNA